MLGSIARKLRFFGFDTRYMVHAHDDDVLSVGIQEGRIILTADRELFKRIVKRNANGVFLDGGTEVENLVHIFSKTGIERIHIDSSDSLCPKCGAMLLKRAPSDMSGLVPESIVSRYDRFFQCSNCGKEYWEGGHYIRMRLLAEQINEQLGAGLKRSTVS